jgi:hypothetical protein
VSARDAGDQRTGEIGCEIGEDRTRKVACGIRCRAGMRVGQRRAAVDDAPFGAFQMIE